MSDLTLEDIARRVGVSRSTVSRVVNGSPSVSPDVRKKVLEAIDLTGYQPNAAARSLASQHSRMIGLVLPRSVSSFFTDPFFPHLTQGIAYGCNNSDLTLSLFLVGSRQDEEKIYPRISRRGLLDGVLVQSGQPDDSLVAQLAKSTLPTVILGRTFEEDMMSYVDVDNVSAAARATRHLISLGYERIATITGNPGSAVTIDRLAGYRQALNETGRTVEEALIVEGDFTEASGYTGMKQLLEQRPDAVFAASDIMAVGAMRAAQEAGLHIPEDIAFVGFDDLPIASTNLVGLTTIRQPILQIGLRAVEILIDIIANGIKPVRHIILETELIIRESCGAKYKERVRLAG